MVSRRGALLAIYDFYDPKPARKAPHDAARAAARELIEEDEREETGKHASARNKDAPDLT